MNASKLIFQTLSPLVTGRVYPVIVPESQAKTIAGKSYIVYTLVSSNPENSNDGFEGHEYALMQIDVYSPSYSDTDVLMLQVINALNNIKAEIGSRQSLPDPNPKIFRQSLDIHVWGTTF